MKHIVCFSGGHSSALVAVEVVKKFGAENTILLNHDINPKYELSDIKRFKNEISEYLKIPITYANILGIDSPENIPNQFQVCQIAKAFKVSNGQELCTNRLKTAPFNNYMIKNVPPGSGIVYYGFDSNEKHRMSRRKKIIESMGYSASFPLAEWTRTIHSTNEIGILPPNTYQVFKHANCIGCLKAGKQHWYVVYCLFPDIYKEAMDAEERIGYTIHPDESLGVLADKFDAMQIAGISATEHIPPNKFWAMVRKTVPGTNFQQTLLTMPCECIL